ncbi:MAG: bifunctional riboflavin kinase/FAD synthetase [Acidimicrobiia bacterium]|nr:bifunctional riboflavin kinase/FAD synthetase [Acidimicrobiia bacterium]
MQIVRDAEPCPPPSGGSVVTIGAYDGVHRGHVAVINQVRALAAERGLTTAVVTFDEHPAAIVRPESAPALLCDLDQKLELLAATGIDRTVVVRFDEVRAKESAEDFVTSTLVGCLDARLVVVGADFHFGHERRGNVALLDEMGRQVGFEVRPIDLVGTDGQPAGDGAKVSSTAIRAALRAGELEAANHMLGRPHEVRGRVGHGDKRARDLGFPTANVAVDGRICLPADGIYAGWCTREDGSVHPTAISLGRRPTFYEDQPVSLLEAHLLDVDPMAPVDLYGESLRVSFVARLRDEERFDSVEALVAQMGRDCEQARTLLTSSSEAAGFDESPSPHG